MFRNILDSVTPNAPNLQHISLLTGIKYYMGNFSDMSNKNERHDCPFSEDFPRLNQESFYHNLEDILWEAAAKKNDLTWSIHRPALIFGFSPCSLMNIVSTLCVYAAICKHENKPLVYTGTEVSWAGFSDAVDANLLADHFVWTATDPKAKNQASNCNNGDVFTWKRLWKVLGNQFNLESVGYVEGKEPVLLEVLMKGKDSVWDEIVQKNNLVPTKLSDIAAFWFVDIAFKNRDTLSSMNKNKKFGFMGFRDTTESFISCVKKMRDHRFIP